MTLGIYAQAWDWSEEERERLRALWSGEPLASVDRDPAVTGKGRGAGNPAAAATPETATLESAA
jgi:hypothetical protein